MAEKGVHPNDGASSCSSSTTPLKKDTTPVGILRIDMGKPRRASTESKLLSKGEPVSPQPSVDRLSVTFADESVKSDSSTKCNYYTPSSTLILKMDKGRRFQQSAEENKECSDEEDYSASVNAIIQRRQSTKRSTRRRRSSRRTSSPFSPDILPSGTENGRRRSSVYTTSSGDTAITVDDNINEDVTQDEIFENIKLHKEVLSSVKMQPWNMRKKLKLVLQAKSYIKKHEGALQERLAQSHSTKDMLARWNILINQRWQRFKREAMNLSNWFIPWELKIKEIESHFGSVVASYFIFLRWLFWVNIVLAVVIISFVAIPEMLTADPKTAGDRKYVLKEEKYNSTNFLTLWDFEGVFKYSPLFYGWYTNAESTNLGYKLPLAYFLTGLVAYAYSFIATLRKMAENSRMSKLSEKDDECIFSWKLFTAWDYMIGNPETAHNRVASIVVGFKEALLEEAEKMRQSRDWKVIGFRILVNSVVLGLLTFSASLVVLVVKRSTEPEATSTAWRRNEITVVLSLISTFFPMLFEGLGFLEQYHPRKQLRLQLARIMVMNLLNLYSLIFALFDKIGDMTMELEILRNQTSTPEATTSSYPNPLLECFLECENDSNLLAANMIMELTSNISTSVIPLLQEALKSTSSTLNETTIWNENFSTEFYQNFTSFFLNSTNETMSTVDDSIFDNFKEAFVDYLHYVLFNNEIDDFSSNSTDDDNVTTNFSSTTLEYFKSTLASYTAEETTRDLDETFDYNLTSTIIDEEISSSLATFTTTFRNCSKICQNKSLDGNFSVSPELNMNYSTKYRLRSLCWETMFGQELIKLTVMDLVLTVISTLAMDFARGIFVRVMNRCWCWNLEKQFPQYGDFKVAENILHLVNNQGMVWMGMFFSPGLIVINVVKLYALMYLRAWAVLTCNVPHEIIFRASRSNNFYYSLLLMMLFLCVLPVGYAIVWLRPSWHCGPFSQYHRIFHIFTKTIKRNVPEPVERALDYIASPGIVIPLLVLLILIIYYLVSLTGALREANNDLKIQLRRERTEERRKMFQLADRRRRRSSGGSGDNSNTPFAKWKKILGATHNIKSFDDSPTPKQDSVDAEYSNPPLPSIKQENRGIEFFSKLIKKALKKTPSISEDDNNQNNADDGTDTEQHESLPEDVASVSKEIKPQVHRPGRSSFSAGNFDIQRTVTNALISQKRTSNNSPKVSEIEDNTSCRFKIKTTNQFRQDSGSSIWSDNIPVIKISKTESSEYLDKRENLENEENEKKQVEFKPRIKSVLHKQTTEIDENFGETGLLDVDCVKSESSEDTPTTREGSIDTILKSPIIDQTSAIDEDQSGLEQEGEPETKSSSGYADVASI